MHVLTRDGATEAGASVGKAGLFAQGFRLARVMSLLRFNPHDRKQPPPTTNPITTSLCATDISVVEAFRCNVMKQRIRSSEQSHMTDGRNFLLPTSCAAVAYRYLVVVWTGSCQLLCQAAGDNRGKSLTCSHAATECFGWKIKLLRSSTTLCSSIVLRYPGGIHFDLSSSHSLVEGPRTGSMTLQGPCRLIELKLQASPSLFQAPFQAENLWRRSRKCSLTTRPLSERRTGSAGVETFKRK